MNKLRSKNRRRFKFVKQQHIDYMKEIMEDKYLKDRSIDHKVILMKRKFGEEIPLSRSTVWNVSLLLFYLII